MPSMLELQQEYESLGVEFVYLSLDADSPEQAVALMAELEGPSFYRLTTPLEQAAALLGIHEPPAVLGYRTSTSCDLSIGCSFGPGPGKLELTNNSEPGETE
jgi:hypothetical protein